MLHRIAIRRKVLHNFISLYWIDRSRHPESLYPVQQDGVCRSARIFGDRIAGGGDDDDHSAILQHITPSTA
jgi:hypothetical protein